MNELINDQNFLKFGQFVVNSSDNIKYRINNNWLAINKIKIKNNLYIHYINLISNIDIVMNSSDIMLPSNINKIIANSVERINKLLLLNKNLGSFLDYENCIPKNISNTVNKEQMLYHLALFSEIDKSHIVNTVSINIERNKLSNLIIENKTIKLSSKI